VKHLQE
jgi:hypothetical protein